MKLLTLSDKQCAANTDLHALLTKQEIAPLLKLSVRAVDDWMRAGRLPYLKCGKSVRFRWADVVEHLERYRVQ